MAQSDLFSAAVCCTRSARFPLIVGRPPLPPRTGLPCVAHYASVYLLYIPDCRALLRYSSRNRVHVFICVPSSPPIHLSSYSGDLIR